MGRSDETRQLMDGWLDGAGLAPRSDRLDWFVAAFERHYPDELPPPRIYPTAWRQAGYFTVTPDPWPRYPAGAILNSALTGKAPFSTITGEKMYRGATGAVGLVLDSG